MPATRPARAILERDFLETRGKLLELAAALDRLDAGTDADAEQLAADPRRDQLRRAVELLGRAEPGRAEAVQMLFSDPYDPDWLGRDRPTGRS